MFFQALPTPCICGAFMINHENYYVRSNYNIAPGQRSQLLDPYDQMHLPLLQFNQLNYILKMAQDQDRYKKNMTNVSK